MFISLIFKLMDEYEEDFTTKQLKTNSESVVNITNEYLEKRNYPVTGVAQAITAEQEINLCLITNGISNRNSIVYSRYNNDPNVIEYNFEKFIKWSLNIVHTSPEEYHDINKLIPPLFCHLYFELERSAQSSRCKRFFDKYQTLIQDKLKSPNLIDNLLNVLNNGDNNNDEIVALKKELRESRYRVYLNRKTIVALKQFIATQCHVILLNIFQKWIEIVETEDDEDLSMHSTDESTSICEDENDIESTNRKIQRLQNARKLLNLLTEPIFIVTVSNAKEHVDCAILNRYLGIVVYNQMNRIHIKPLHSYDSILAFGSCKEIHLSDHSKRVFSIVISPNYGRLVSGSADCTVNIYDLNTMQLDQVCEGHLGSVYAVSISSCNTFIGSASADHTARLWHLSNGENLRIFVGHTQSVTCIDFHPNCLYLATGSSDKTLRLWSVDNGNSLRLFSGSKGTIYSLAINPTGETIVCSNDAKYVYVFDLLTTKRLNQFKYYGDTITKVVWRNGGREVCCGSIDGVLRIWKNAMNTMVNLETSDESEDEDEEGITKYNCNGSIRYVNYCMDAFECLVYEQKCIETNDESLTDIEVKQEQMA